MIKRGFIKGNLSVDSAKQRLNGLCPLMPEEVCYMSCHFYFFELFWGRVVIENDPCLSEVVCVPLIINDL